MTVEMSYADQLDAGAKALRELDMAGRITLDWSKVPKSQKRKWFAKAAAVLSAAGVHPADRSDGLCSL